VKIKGAVKLLLAMITRTRCQSIDVGLDQDMTLERSFSAKTMTISSLVHPSRSSSLLLGEFYPQCSVPYSAVAIIVV
jgi:hypothetical protein